jgi:hypothetical protein
MTARIRALIFLGLAMLVPLLSGALQAQDPKETERLKAELAALRAELEALQNQVDSEVTALRTSAGLGQPGTTRFLITGYGLTGYSKTQGVASTFATEVSPILLWQLNERLLFQAETEFEMEEELATNVEYAHVSYLAADFVSFGAGKFLTPFGIFNQRLHPGWINKVPNSPLAFGHGGIAPGSGVGAYARGAFPIGAARAGYAVYGINAPELMTMADEAGEVTGADESEERAYGGRVSLFLVRSGLEVGYSYQTSNVAVMSGLDASLTRQIAPLRGNLDVRFEAGLSNASEGPFPGAMPGDPVRSLIDNRREGGYGQLAYRPSLLRSRFLRNVEIVGRYEWLNRPDWQGGPLGNDTKRYTAGALYSLAPSMQLKLAFQSATHTMESNTRSILFQVATGF